MRTAYLQEGVVVGALALHRHQRRVLLPLEDQMARVGGDNPTAHRRGGDAVAARRVGKPLVMTENRENDRSYLAAVASHLGMTVPGRSVACIWRTVQHVDLVHALYYTLMHGLFRLFGGELLTLRLPSVVAESLAAAGVGLLGRRLAGSRVGLLARPLFPGPARSRTVRERDRTGDDGIDWIQAANHFRRGSNRPRTDGNSCESTPELSKAPR
ncbi:hypothetical protein [Streptomyces sp. UG1]|uniref:hypothetical protein n=1 Tax=Streptomyces sp. UG1 TaxID=3417652 RepID=UPI003CED9882